MGLVNFMAIGGTLEVDKAAVRDDRPATACKSCGRAVYRADVDASGRCCFCAPAAHVASQPEASK